MCFGGIAGPGELFTKSELDAAIASARADERELGPCRKHPKACVKMVPALMPEPPLSSWVSDGYYCTVCAEIDKLKAERDANVAQLKQDILAMGNAQERILVLEAERDAMRERLQGLVEKWHRNGEGSRSVNRHFGGQPTPAGCSMITCAEELAALLSKEGKT